MPTYYTPLPNTPTLASYSLAAASIMRCAVGQKSDMQRHYRRTDRPLIGRAPPQCGPNAPQMAPLNPLRAEAPGVLVAADTFRRGLSARQQADPSLASPSLTSIQFAYRMRIRPAYIGFNLCSAASTIVSFCFSPRSGPWPVVPSTSYSRACFRMTKKV